MDDLRLGILNGSHLQNTLAQKSEALAYGAAPKDAMERKHAAQEFASFLYLEVLKAMRATLPKDGLFENDSLSRDIYAAMFDTELARVLAKRDGEGFTGTVERAIEKMVPVLRAEGVGAPVGGTLTSSFGVRHDPIHGNKGFHAGLDIAVPAGTEVKAVSRGRVIFGGTISGYGNIVEIDHGGGMVTRYAHNAANLVTIGEQIEAGQAIVIVGNTGRTTGTHLHFEVRQNGKLMDPAPLIGAVAKGSRMSVIV
jgi:murein DD-endopeptidase MepM/ murein hydrolase activator NlpD